MLHTTTEEHNSNTHTHTHTQCQQYSIRDNDTYRLHDQLSRTTVSSLPMRFYEQQSSKADTC